MKVSVEFPREQEAAQWDVSTRQTGYVVGICVVISTGDGVEPQAVLPCRDTCKVRSGSAGGQNEE